VGSAGGGVRQTGRLAEAVLDRDRRSARPFFDTWATWHLKSSGGLQRGPTLFAVRRGQGRTTKSNLCHASLALAHGKDK
jgi:hypothetical protein